MKLTNTYISKDCTRKVLVYVDKNGHYEVERYITYPNAKFPVLTRNGRTHFKHIESAHKAIKKFIQ